MSKYQQWYDSLPEHTKTYLKSQPLWHDRDLYKAFAFGTIFGIIIGLCI
jgi:hypothetical protein